MRDPVSISHKRKPTPRLQKRVKSLLKRQRELLSQLDEMCRENRAIEQRLAYVTGQRDLLAEGNHPI